MTCFYFKVSKISFFHSPFTFMNKKLSIYNEQINNMPNFEVDCILMKKVVRAKLCRAEAL